jgi:hypothetical protein
LSPLLQAQNKKGKRLISASAYLHQVEDFLSHCAAPLSEFAFSLFSILTSPRFLVNDANLGEK